MKRAKYLNQWHRRWERVIRLRNKGLTFDEIGAKLGVTRQMASRLHKKGIIRAKQIMGE